MPPYICTGAELATVTEGVLAAVTSQATIGSGA
jgi:hypothetical protein